MKKDDESKTCSQTERATGLVLEGVLTQDQPMVPAEGTVEALITRIL